MSISTKWTELEGWNRLKKKRERWVQVFVSCLEAETLTQRVQWSVSNWNLEDRGNTIVRQKRWMIVFFSIKTGSHNRLHVLLLDERNSKSPNKLTTRWCKWENWASFDQYFLSTSMKMSHRIPQIYTTIKC